MSGIVYRNSPFLVSLMTRHTIYYKFITAAQRVLRIPKLSNITFTSATIFRKCGGKTSLGGQERLILKAHYKLPYPDCLIQILLCITYRASLKVIIGAHWSCDGVGLCIQRSMCQPSAASICCVIEQYT